MFGVVQDICNDLSMMFNLVPETCNGTLKVYIENRHSLFKVPGKVVKIFKRE